MDMDSLTYYRALSKEEIEFRSISIVEIWSLLRINDSKAFKRSKSRWLIGDTNYGFFQASIKSRSMGNTFLP